MSSRNLQSRRPGLPSALAPVLFALVFVLVVPSTLSTGAHPTGPSRPTFSTQSLASPGAATVAAVGLGASLPAYPGASNVLSLNSSPQWHLSTTKGPPVRTAEAMASDPKDGYVVMTGGWGTISGRLVEFDDTWAYALGHWTNLTTSHRPSATLYASMAYDAKDGYVVLFGGCILSIGCPSQTWTYTGGNWTRLTPLIAPDPSLEGASLTYDARDGYMVLFGGSVAGCSGACSYDTNYTWKFAGGTWTNITSAVAPSPRYSAATAFDVKDGHVVLFGGGTRLSCTGTCPLRDTWKFAGGTWSRVNTTSSPPARYMAGMVYDVHESRLILYGGSSAAWPPLNDTWTYARGVWSKVTVSSSPPAQYYFGLAYGPVGGRVVLLQPATLSRPVAVTWVFI
jgi:hypothetical protein